MIIKENCNDFIAYTDDNQQILSVSTYETTVPNGNYEEVEVCTIDGITCISTNTEEQLSALKNIFEYLRNKYDRYPGIDNHFTELDTNERKLIATLIERGDIPAQLLLNSEDAVGEPDLTDKKVVQNLINSTATSRTGFSQSGFLPYTSMLQASKPRSFVKERFPQLLRQIATQLYHFSCSKGLSPTEVQVMYLHDALFISANSKASVLSMCELLCDNEQLKRALTTPYNYDGTTAVDKKISARHAAKLLARLYGAYSCDDPRFAKVKDILNIDSKISLIELPNTTGITGTGNIYFVCGKLKADRHAEENLLDILEHFTEEIAAAKLKPAIFGKKRPCFTCHARLEATVEQFTETFSLQSPAFEFNPNKGLLFKATAYAQTKHPLSAKATAASLGAYSDVVYTSTEGDSSYATASDSEIEDDISGVFQKMRVG